MKFATSTYCFVPSVDGTDRFDLFVEGRIRVEIVQPGDLPAGDEVA